MEGRDGGRSVEVCKVQAGLVKRVGDIPAGRYESPANGALRPVRCQNSSSPASTSSES